MFKVKSSSTGNGQFQYSRDSKRHFNKNFGSITGFSSDRFKTPHISESRLSHEASRSCKSRCVLSCCNSCSFCSYHRASAKERSKSRTSVEKNKACEQCFLCRSMSFCPKCSRCPHCCARWSCRRPSSKVLASLAKVRRKPSGSLHFKGGLQPTFQIKTSSHQGSNHSEQLCQSGQKPFPQRGTDLSPRKVGSGASPGPVFSHLLQPAVFSTQTGKQVAAYFRSESVEQVPQNRHIQDGNSGNHPDLSLPQKGEWVTSLDFSDTYFHIPIHPRSRKYMRFFLNKRAYQFTALPFGLATAPLEFTKIVKEVKLMAQNRGIRIHQYLDDWLLRAPSREIGLLHTQVLLSLCHELGWSTSKSRS